MSVICSLDFSINCIASYCLISGVCGFIGQRRGPGSLFIRLCRVFGDDVDGVRHFFHRGGHFFDGSGLILGDVAKIRTALRDHTSPIGELTCAFNNLMN